jgi:hypothetical protein
MIQFFYVFTKESTSPDGTWYYVATDLCLWHADEVSGQDIILMTMLSQQINVEGSIKPWARSFGSYDEAFACAASMDLKGFTIKFVQMMDL